MNQNGRESELPHGLSRHPGEGQRVDGCGRTVGAGASRADYTPVSGQEPQLDLVEPVRMAGLVGRGRQLVQGRVKWACRPGLE
jgi:hypothetical protein